ncbi:CopG family transcriptional regulator [Candidatus Berkelbacteria bacterium]|nr:CopG family transcriptional regulator [Candidatus Berkelbacteria bacterium]
MPIKTVNISFPQNLLKEIDEFARSESLSRSDVLRMGAKNFIRNYTAWKAIQNYGSQKALQLGFKNEQEVVKRIFE